MNLHKTHLIGLAIVLFVALPVFAQSPFTPADALEIQSLSSLRINADGSYIAGIKSQRSKGRLNVDHFRFGDPTYVRPSQGELVIYNTKDASETPLTYADVHVSDPAWSPDGTKLAFLIYKEERFELHLYELQKKKSRKVEIKTELAIASNTDIDWLPDNRNVLLQFREKGWHEEAKKMFLEASEGPVVVYDSEEPFLKWDAIRNLSGKAALHQVDTRNGNAKELLPSGSRGSFEVAEDGNSVSYTEFHAEKTSYNRKDGTKYELRLKDLKAPKDSSKVLIEKSFKRISVQWSKDKSWFAWADSGHVFLQHIYADASRNLTKGKNKLIEEDTVEVKFSPLGWAASGKQILASSKQGLWTIDVEKGDPTLFHKFEEEEDQQPQLRFMAWPANGRYLYLNYAAKDKWERGLVRYDFEQAKMEDLRKDSKLYYNWEMSKDGSTIFYTQSDGDLPEDLYVANTDLKQAKRITELNPWVMDKKMTKSELVEYLDVDGKKLYGILYYPTDYEEGKKYPLVCEIYERFFNNGYRSSANIIANAGYFMFRPSVNLEKGYPGEAWMKGVTSGINKLIEKGLVDEDKLGVHGTSYGGYAASLLISQTQRFSAAINISGKVNIISFLGDSPKIGTRNYAAAEVGQDRIGQSLWEAPMKYFAHSAVLNADRINTPHLLLTGEGDWNVPGTNTRELYYAMRRLGKKVVWVNYMKAGHGAGFAGTKDDYFDQWDRILDWYKTHFEESKEEVE